MQFRTDAVRQVTLTFVFAFGLYGQTQPATQPAGQTSDSEREASGFADAVQKMAYERALGNVAGFATAAAELHLSEPRPTDGYEGMFVRASDTVQVYYIEGGKKRYVGSANTIKCLGSQPDDEMVVPKQVLDLFTLGKPKADCTISPGTPKRPVVGAHIQTFFEGSEHVEAWVHVFRTGYISGRFRMADDRNIGGFCAGYAVGVYKSDGTLLKPFFPASGCVEARPGQPHERVRWVDWDDHFSTDIAKSVEKAGVVIREVKGESRFPWPAPTI